MANIKQALEKVLRWEGGISNHPNDKGGLTAYGITQNTYSNYYEGSVINITKEQIETIYRVGYWNKINGDLINNQSVAELLFDFAVNSGARTAVTKIQMLLGVKTDGVCGPKTVAAINAKDPKVLFNELHDVRVAFYKSIVTKNSSQKVFLKGWLNRVNSYTIE